MSRIVTTLRNHLHFVVIVPLLIIVMTWPTFRYVFDTEVFWLPTNVQDVWTNFWNAWYSKLLLSGQANFYFTELMFYPEGVSLSFHNFVVPHMLLLNVLDVFLPVTNAYNLAYLISILVSTVSAYIYLLYLVRHRWIGLFGAIVFGCSIYVISRPSQPLVSMVFAMPLTLYYVHRAVLEKRWQLAAISGLWAGITAFTGYYTYICILIALGMYILYFALGRWRKIDYWLRVSVLLVIAGAFGFVRAWPMISDAQGLEAALTKGAGVEYNNDLLQYFFNMDHPVMTPLVRDLFNIQLDLPWPNSAYLGYVPLLLIAIGLLRPTYRRKMLFWLALMTPFFLLRLGSILTIDGQQYSNLVLPKQLLEQLLLPVFGAFYSTEYFHSGTLLPLAVLSCYGLMTLLHRIRSRFRLPLISLLIIALAFEYYISREQFVLPPQQLAFSDWLAEGDDMVEIRLINVPMGRVNAKLYDFYQTLNGFPHAEGIAGRTPDSAYDYIRDNYLLGTWSADKSVSCDASNQVEYLVALDALERDGFTHVIMHHQLWNSANVAESFPFADAAYEDEFSAVYRLADLRASCPDHLPGRESASHLRDFLATPAIAHRNNEAILSFHETALDEKLVRYFREEAEDWKDLIIASPEESNSVRIQSSNPDVTALDAIAEANSIIWLVYNSQVADLQFFQGFYDSFEGQYKSCRRIQADDDAVYEYAVRSEFPCELVDSDSTLAVRYDSGIEMAERLTEVGSENVRIYLWWSNPREGGYAYSIQVI